MPATPVEARFEVAAARFHALADSTRLEIVQLLTRGEHCVCELMRHMDAAQSRLSFHLKTLKDAGLVLDRKDGRWVYYRLNPRSLEEIAELAQSAAKARGDRQCCGGPQITQVSR